MDVDRPLNDIIRNQWGTTTRGGRGFIRGGRGGRGGSYRGSYQPRNVYIPRQRPFVIGGTSGPVRVNMANLHNVNVEDLEELFVHYPHDGITMHFDENGIPVGTADIHFKSRPAFASKLVKDCNGMRIDGRPIKFYLLGSRPNLHYLRPSFRQPFNHLNSYTRSVGRVYKTPRRGAGNFGGNPKLTEDELNAQIDAYMSK